MTKRSLIISTNDLSQIQAAVNSARQDSRVPTYLLDALETELSRARVVDPWDLPNDVVALNSTVWFCDETTGDHECYTLVLPRHADVSQSRISVIAPIGTALIGYRVGDLVEWAVPAGLSRLRITDVQHASQSENHRGLVLTALPDPDTQPPSCFRLPVKRIHESDPSSNPIQP
jgi:regulator of nucleoside diphosphate kinase